MMFLSTTFKAPASSGLICALKDAVSTEHVAVCRSPWLSLSAFVHQLPQSVWKALHPPLLHLGSNLPFSKRQHQRMSLEARHFIQSNPES